MKTCKKCGIEKQESEFGKYKERYKNRTYIGLKGTCKKCLAKIQKEKARKERATPEGRAKHNQWASDRYHRRKEEYKIENKKRRATPEYKAYVKKYRADRKEKIYQQEVVTKKRYHEKNRDKITDKYVVNLLRNQGFGTSDELMKNKELIEIKRGEILLSRIKEKTKNLSKKINHG